MSPPRRKPAVALSKVPTVKEICDRLGFRASSAKETSIFLDITHAFRKSYIAPDGRAGTDFISWNSQSVQQDLYLMAHKFLNEGANGERFWSETKSWRQEADLLYPDDKIRIAELLKQLFWKQNRYALHNSKYTPPSRAQSEDQRPKVKETAQRLKSKPSLKLTLKRPRAAPPAQLPENIGTSPQRVLYAKPTVVDLSSDEDENINNPRSNNPAQNPVPNTTRVDLYEFNGDSFDRAQEKGNTEPPRTPIPLDRCSNSKQSNQVESSNGRQPHKRLKTGHTVRGSGSEGVNSTYQGRLRPLGLPNYKVIESFSDDTDEEGDTSQHQQNGQPKPQALQDMGQASQAQRENLVQTGLDVPRAEVTPLQRPFVAAVAPMVGILPATGPGLEPLSSSLRMVAQAHSPEACAPKAQLSLPAQIGPKHSVQVEYWIVTREPSYREERWDDCKFSGKSLSVFVDEISRKMRRDSIEELKLTLQTPLTATVDTVRPPAEDSWEKLKDLFRRKMMDFKKKLEARAGHQSAVSNFCIYIEPRFSQPLLTLLAADDVFDF